MAKVLITGGAGFIGGHLCRRLIADGNEVRILDTLSPQVHGMVPAGADWLREFGIDFMRGSVTSRSDVELALNDITQIVHLAAETGTGQSMYEISRYNEINSQGTATLLDVLASNPSHRVERIILASSRSVYGEGAYVCSSCNGGRKFPGARTSAMLAAHKWEPSCPDCGHELTVVATREDDLVRPASIYAATKFAQEDLVRVASEALGISYAILRFQNVYGEGQSLKNPYTGILSIFSNRIRRQLELSAFEDGKETRDFVHVYDIVMAISRCLSISRPLNTVINVGSGMPTSVLDIATMLSEALGEEPRVRITAEYRLGDIRHNFADISRLKHELGYSPEVTLSDGLRRFAEWVLTQPLQEDLLEKANAELRARKLMG